MHILVINGPNINMLGIREPDIYGKNTYADLCRLITDYADEKNIAVELFQSNHEGEIVDKIQQAYGKADGIVINPAAYTHTSIAISMHSNPLPCEKTFAGSALTVTSEALIIFSINNACKALQIVL